MIGYLKEFDDIKLFKKYCKIWKTIKDLLETEFDLFY